MLPRPLPCGELGSGLRGGSRRARRGRGDGPRGPSGRQMLSASRLRSCLELPGTLHPGPTCPGAWESPVVSGTCLQKPSGA